MRLQYNLLYLHAGVAYWSVTVNDGLSGDVTGFFFSNVFPLYQVVSSRSSTLFEMLGNGVNYCTIYYIEVCNTMLRSFNFYIYMSQKAYMLTRHDRFSSRRAWLWLFWACVDLFSPLRFDSATFSLAIRLVRERRVQSRYQRTCIYVCSVFLFTLPAIACNWCCGSGIQFGKFSVAVSSV